MDSRVSFSCVWSGANENYSSKLKLLFLDVCMCVCQILPLHILFNGGCRDNDGFSFHCDSILSFFFLELR